MRRSKTALASVGGLTLLVSLAAAIAVIRLSGERHGLAIALDPRLVDLGSLLLNVVLVLALARFAGLRRGSG